MDVRVIIILCLEALLCMLILYRTGVIKQNRIFLWAAALTAVSFGLREICLSHETLDYLDFLKNWVQFFRDNGGFKALQYPIGNYNIPYLYFLALFSYSGIYDLYLIKLLSILFDILLAWGVMNLVSLYTKSKTKKLVAFFLPLFCPTVILNGSLWGQCDSIYAALAVWAVGYGLRGKGIPAMVFMALSFGFKLQAVFIMPVFVALWYSGKIEFKHFWIFPLTYVLLVLPAVLLGRPFFDTISLYFSQTGSIGDGLNYNSPSVFGIFDTAANLKVASTLGIIAAFVWMFAVLLIAYMKRDSLDNLNLLLIASLLCIGIPFLLPHMHDRYFFVADVITLVLAVVDLRLIPAAVLTQLASLLSYYAYLTMRYFSIGHTVFTMNYGAWLLIFVLIYLSVYLYACMKEE